MENAERSSQGRFIPLSEAQERRRNFINVFGPPDDDAKEPGEPMQFRMFQIDVDKVKTLLEFQHRGEPAAKLLIFPGIKYVQTSVGPKLVFQLIMGAATKDGTLITTEMLDPDVRERLEPLTGGNYLLNDWDPCPPPGCPKDVI